MKKSIIKLKSFEFAVKIVDICKTLTNEQREYVLSKQLLRSGTAIGALVHEAEQAESKPDFIHKLAIAQKEASESEYWIELLHHTNYLEQKRFNSLMEELRAIRRILSSIFVTTKQRMEKL